MISKLRGREIGNNNHYSSTFYFLQVIYTYIDDCGSHYIFLDNYYSIIVMLIPIIVNFVDDRLEKMDVG